MQVVIRNRRPSCFRSSVWDLCMPPLLRILHDSKACAQHPASSLRSILSRTTDFLTQQCPPMLHAMIALPLKLAYNERHAVHMHENVVRCSVRQCCATGGSAGSSRLGACAKSGPLDLDRSPDRAATQQSRAAPQQPRGACKSCVSAGNSAVIGAIWRSVLPGPPVWSALQPPAAACCSTMLL